MPSPVKQIVNYHISRLSSKNADARLDAIQELQKLNDPDALEPLQKLFKSDPDLGVRKAAQEAGRIIYVNNQNKA